MAITTVALVLAGKGGSLSFRDGTGAKRRVLPGVPFEVNAVTAAILLVDPSVSVFVDSDVPRGTETHTPDAASSSGLPRPLDAYRALKARAKELGLPASGKAAELAAAVAAEEARLAAAAPPEGGTTPADDPDASATGEAGTPPAGSGTGGAIVLGDLPDSAKIGR